MLRPYQSELARKAARRVAKHGLCYLAVEMRVGKTLISMQTAKNLQARSVVFITKLKAIDSIVSDYEAFGFVHDFVIAVFNYEQIHKHTSTIRNADLVILDEAHGLGQFPKPALKTKALKELITGKPVLYLSGTPSPESYSQLYHQLWVCSRSPWAGYKSFYAWAKDYVDVRERRIGMTTVKDYSAADRDKVMRDTDPFFLSFTQEDAGFEVSDVDETVIEVDMQPETYRMIAEMTRKRMTTHRTPHGMVEIIADTAAAYRMKVHQMFSGTFLHDATHDNHAFYIFDYTKAKYIRDNYAFQKVAIFYQFRAEKEMLRLVIPDITEDPKEFASNPHMTYISQIQAGSQGVDLSAADVLVFLNLNFSAMHYWQSRARLQTMTRTKQAKVHYVFAKNGIEHKILQTVRRKEDYTTAHFMRDFR
jgi:hypothetical protein